MKFKGKPQIEFGFKIISVIPKILFEICIFKENGNLFLNIIGL